MSSAVEHYGYHWCRMHTVVFDVKAHAGVCTITAQTCSHTRQNLRQFLKPENMLTRCVSLSSEGFWGLGFNAEIQLTLIVLEVVTCGRKVFLASQQG